MDQGLFCHRAFREWAVQYVDEWGFMTPQRLPPSNGAYVGGGNVLLYTALYYTILAMRGAMTQADSDAWIRSLYLCRHKDVMMFWRSPLKKNADDNQEHDDYWGIIAANYHAGAEHINAGILTYAESSGWRFDIQHPGRGGSTRFWFARFLPFQQFLRLASGRTLGLPGTVTLYLAMLWRSYFNTSPSGAIRNFLIASVLRERSSLGRFIYNRCARGELFIGELPASHPLTNSL